MVELAQGLDPYRRQVLAPLGILFPFPLLCPKLDSYMKPEAELRLAIEKTEGLHVKCTLVCGHMIVM